MSQIEKLLQKIKQTTTEVPLKDLKRILEHAGYKKSRQRGSHVHFRKSSFPSITFPVRQQRVRYVYVKQIMKILDL